MFKVQSCCRGSGSRLHPSVALSVLQVKARPDHVMTEQERSCFFSVGVAVAWTLLWSLTQQPEDHCFSVIRKCCGLFGGGSFLFKGTQEVLFTACSNECKATYCLLLPEDITHLIFSVLAERERLDELNLFNPPSSNHIRFYMTEPGMQEFLKLAESIALISHLKC